MLHLAFIYHMHQPYYKNLLTQVSEVPWVRLHGTKDYLDMVQMLSKFPKVHQTFNLVPSLLEQVESYVDHTVKDKFLEVSLKDARELTADDKKFILDNFFSINKEKVIWYHPRFYELYLMKQNNLAFKAQDYLDLQVWFNLAWIDPYFREETFELLKLVQKGRYFSEEEKRAVIDAQLRILEDIIPTYRKFFQSGQVEVTVTPFYHPILPLLYNTKIAKEAYLHTTLPQVNFSYPKDALHQIEDAVKYFRSRFGKENCGMWPSEESVCEHILPFFIRSGVKWIVADEAILFKSLKRKKRDTELLYQPFSLKREEGDLNIVFRDRNLSDMLGFVYYNWKAQDAVSDLMKHFENTAKAFKDKDILLTIAMDGENAWEYYHNDGHEFLELLYERLSEADFLKTVTISEYINEHPPKINIPRLGAGSWIYGNFGKWIGNPQKVRGWEILALARQELDKLDFSKIPEEKISLIWKQMYILEGSDWYWWLGEDVDGCFDRLFRMHLRNFYTLIGKEIPEYLSRPI